MATQADTEHRPETPAYVPIRRFETDSGHPRPRDPHEDPVRRPPEDSVRRPPEPGPHGPPGPESGLHDPAPRPVKHEITSDRSDDGDRDKNDDGDDKDETPAKDSEKDTDNDKNNDGFGDKGSSGKYWEVELVRPPGASEALLSYIALAEAAIQTAVDLLGRGMTVPPPDVGDLLSKVTREALGKGKAEEAYQDTLTKVEAKQTSLLAMDTQVIDTSIVMAGEQDRTLKTIIEIVDRLNDVLTKVGGAKLKPPIENQLLELIATAIDLVYDRVLAVSEFSSEMAGDSGSNDSSGGGKEGSGGAGGGGASGGGANALGGLGSMLPMLAMLPMSLAPMAAQLLPELLDPDKNKDEEGDEESATDEEAPEPIDPTAPPSGATTPEGQPAPGDQKKDEPAAQETAVQA